MRSVTQFLKEIEESGKKEIIEKWTDDDSPFLSLLNMENGILVKSAVAAKLLKMCDPGNHTININGNVYTITAADFVETMGIKSGTDKFGDLQNVQSGELFDKFCAYEKGDEKLPYICRKKVTDRLKVGDEADAKIAYNLLALLRVFLPNRRDRLPTKYLSVIDHKNKDLAELFLQEMFNDIKAYHISKALTQHKIR
ncbi:hypothetical protein L1887_31442 [Cichorium endivia]|nr:hypothetical protein L1887_31442 [Cichorium endivia]